MHATKCTLFSWGYENERTSNLKIKPPSFRTLSRSKTVRKLTESLTFIYKIAFSTKFGIFVLTEFKYNVSFNQFFKYFPG